MGFKLFHVLVCCQGVISFAAHSRLQLPSASAAGPSRAALEKQGKWWTQIDDHMYYQPTSLVGLSTEVAHYYYAVGSLEALTNEMKASRVGGQGRVHIFHLPRGPPLSLLQQFGNAGDRRESFSSLIQMAHGAVITNVFPEYHPEPEYRSPLDREGQSKEQEAVSLVTADSVTRYLEGLTSLPTRSYSNAPASKEAQKFLQDRFSEMGIKSCIHKFSSGGSQLANVVAMIPGRKAGSVTVGAHYDSRPFDGKAPGAEDNGSGVASLLSIANAYSKVKIVPEKTIYFVGFAGEEPGLLGSKAFADELMNGEGGMPQECKLSGVGTSSFLQGRGNSASLHKAIIMDEVGWLSKKPEFPKPTVNLEATDSTREIMQHLVHASKQYNGDAVTVVHNKAPFGSDHMSFLNNGIQAVLTINGDDEAYPSYHKSSDTIDNVNPQFVSQISKMDMAALVRLSGVDTSRTS